jgi:Asp-tRNA(Asn)/Glu-tRNA(Gln) amidotransferase A subunit family amidase
MATVGHYKRTRGSYALGAIWTLDRMLNLRPSASRGETPLNVGPDLARLEEADAPIRSLMPEPGRAERLARAVATAPNGTLHGLVVGVKDIFHVDGLRTTAGSALPAEELSGPEAAAVTLLRGAGAVVLGKTVSTEFAFVEPGPTRNPRNLGHTPGGSSSGSAAAVAAGHCPLARSVRRRSVQ